ncbi:terminase large subunit domain-containing protein, partial [Chitinimonas sp. BJB300]|uniref:terminase large subunit domain-containing protein n=1 Tax=Chitinimonas sp. BJB300 TaxID=1559339 RepID=UPI000C0DAD4A
MSEIHYYPPGPVASAFMNSKAFVRGLLGPIGSGKSVTCCMEIMRRACEQAPDINGRRRTRWVIIRNTYPELKSTTIKTWLEWFPEEHYGRVKWDVPITQMIHLNHDVEMEVIFLALDRPDHVKKLLSLEVTGGWINEARELPKAILDA